MTSTFRSCAVVLLLAGLIAGACGDDQSSDSTVAPPGPPELRVTSILPGNGDIWMPGDGPIKLACEQSIVVNVGPLTNGQLTNWTLRPPRGCPGTPNCGYIVLTLRDGSDQPLFETQAAQTSIGVDLSSVAVEDVQHLRVELFDAASETPFVQTDGGKAGEEIDITFEPAADCGMGGAGGQGGAAGAAGGGAPGEAGAGGHGGA